MEYALKQFTNLLKAIVWINNECYVCLKIVFVKGFGYTNRKTKLQIQLP